MRLYAGSVDYFLTIYSSEPDLPYLLMMHGFMGSSSVFDHIIPQIATFANPVTIDLIGHGKTETPADPALYKTEHQITQLKSILKRLRFERLFLYGYSMGGRLALQLATAHPDFFSGLILESAHCGLSSDIEKKSRAVTDQKRANEILTDKHSFLDKWSALPLFEKTPEPFKTKYRTISEEQNPQQMANSLREFGSGVMPSICHKLPSLHLPVHLVAGSQDPAYVSRMTKMNEQISDSDLHIVNNAGHRIHTDQPEKLLSILSNAMKALNQNE